MLTPPTAAFVMVAVRYGAGEFGISPVTMSSKEIVSALAGAARANIAIVAPMAPKILLNAFILRMFLKT